MNLNAVFDTNMLISGILWRGIPFQSLKWAEEGSLRIYTSLEILTGVYRVLIYYEACLRQDGRFFFS